MLTNPPQIVTPRSSRRNEPLLASRARTSAGVRKGAAMRILVAIGLVGTALVAASPAAATNQSVVGAYGCFLNGGHVYRPAGTDIVVRQRWAAKNGGLAQDWPTAGRAPLAASGGDPV